MKTIVLCGSKEWLRDVTDLINSQLSIPVTIKQCDTSYLLDFVPAKKTMRRANMLISHLSDNTNTNLQLLTIAQCYDVPVAGVQDEGVPPRYLPLVDVLIDSNCERLIDIITQWI